jgi:concentrative nucleoside transporter, CNT family
MPETETPVDAENAEIKIDDIGANIIEAASIGATEGMKLAVNVAAMLLAFLALIAMSDAAVVWVGNQFGQHWSLSATLAYLFAPIAWLMGVEWADCLNVGELLGLRMVTNEFVAYEKFAEWLKAGSSVQLTPRSQVILTYALCGFANFSSIGIQIGGIGAMAPERRADLARLGLRAMLGGTLACFMTACVAGVLI